MPDRLYPRLRKSLPSFVANVRHRILHVGEVGMVSTTKSVSVFPCLYPFTDMNFLRYIENDESAEHYLVKAQKILSKLFDSNSPFLLELNRTLGEVKAMRQHNNKR